MVLMASDKRHSRKAGVATAEGVVVEERVKEKRRELDREERGLEALRCELIRREQILNEREEAARAREAALAGKGAA
jgi:hypothetical protein